MNKHTPGPWKVARNGKEVWHYWGGDDTFAFTKICEVLHQGDIIELKELQGGNARLISSAPELLEALSMLIDRLDYYGNIDIIREEGPIEDARGAIAKAKGE